MRKRLIDAAHILSLVIFWGFIGYWFVSTADQIKSIPVSTTLIAAASGLVAIIMWEGIAKAKEKLEPKKPKRDLMFDHMSPAMRRLAIEEWHEYTDSESKQRRKIRHLEDKKARMKRELHIMKNLHSRVQARYIFDMHSKEEEICDPTMVGANAFAERHHYVGFTSEEETYVRDAALLYAEQIAWDTAEKEAAEVPCIHLGRKAKMVTIRNMYRIRQALVINVERHYNRWYDFFYTGRDGVWNSRS